MWEMSPVISLLRAAVASRRLSTSTVNGEHRMLIKLKLIKIFSFFLYYILVSYRMSVSVLIHLLTNV